MTIPGFKNVDNFIHIFNDFSLKFLKSLFFCAKYTKTQMSIVNFYFFVFGIIKKLKNYNLRQKNSHAFDKTCPPAWLK